MKDERLVTFAVNLAIALAIMAVTEIVTIENDLACAILFAACILSLTIGCGAFASWLWDQRDKD